MRRESGAHARPREARLLSASAHLYPGVPADIWVQAATMTDIVWSKRLQRGTGALHDRVLDPAHFEFREGGETTPSAAGLRRRATDSLRLRGD